LTSCAECGVVLAMFKSIQFSVERGSRVEGGQGWPRLVSSLGFSAFAEASAVAKAMADRTADGAGFELGQRGRGPVSGFELGPGAFRVRNAECGEERENVAELRVR
jgi:hypothetical protein